MNFRPFRHFCNYGLPRLAFARLAMTNFGCEFLKINCEFFKIKTKNLNQKISKKAEFQRQKGQKRQKMTKFKAFSKKPLVIKIAARVLWLVQWLLFLSCRKHYSGQALLDKPCVLLFFHGKLALMPFIFRRFWQGKKRAFVMISQHEDGELITQNIENFGIDTVRGSTFRGATEVIRQAFRVLDTGNDVAITPDGPRGPYHSISDGSVAIAMKKKVPILLLNYEASSFWEFKSWDKMILPKPFSHIKYRISEPLFLENLEKNEAKAKIQENFAIISKMDSFEREKNV